MDRKKKLSRANKKDRTAYLGQMADEVANISKRHELNGWIGPGEGYENMNLVLAPDDPTSLDLRVPTTRRVRSVGRNKSSAGASTRRSALQGFKKAVLIGVRYKGERRELVNSVTETKKLSKLLQDFGFVGEQIVLVDDTASGDRPTRENILKAIRWMVDGLRPGDSAFLSFYGLGSQSHVGISPLDHIHAGDIKDDLLRDLLVSSVTGGVQIFCVCDAGFKTMIDLPFKIWAEDRGIGERQQQHENTSVSPELIILSGCKVGQSGPGGSLLPAFTSVLRDRFLASRGTWRDLLIGIRGHIRDCKSSLVPQLCSNVNIDFGAPFSFEKGGSFDNAVIPEISPQRSYPKSDSPSQIQQRSPSPSRSLANPHFYESAIHHAARMGWTPSAGPPVPPKDLQDDTFNGEGYASQNGKMQVRVTAPQGCRIELQCQPLDGKHQSAGPQTITTTDHQVSPPHVVKSTLAVQKMNSSSPQRQSSPGQLSAWEGSRETTPNSVMTAATSEHKKKKKKVKPSLPKVGVKKPSKEDTTKMIEAQVQEIVAREAEKLYRSKKAVRRVPKPVAQTISSHENQKRILQEARAREKVIESENLEHYRRRVEADAPVRELRERVAEDEKQDAQKSEYLDRLARHVERVNSYGRMKLPKTPKQKPIPKSPTYELTQQYGFQQRMSPSPPREHSPRRYQAETRAVNEVSKLHTVTNDLLQQHMLQRRVLENQLNNLQEQNSVTTFASERSLTPEMASACVQTLPDAFRKEALLAIANRIDWSRQHQPRTPPVVCIL